MSWNTNDVISSKKGSVKHLASYRRPWTDCGKKIYAEERDTDENTVKKPSCKQCMATHVSARDHYGNQASHYADERDREQYIIDKLNRKTVE